MATTDAAPQEASAGTRAPARGPFRMRLQIMAGEEGAMGPGKAALLEAIDQTGSISAAGRSLGISYRRCWLMVDEMNRCWRQPLVEARRGGREQGARVSVAGMEVLAAYRSIEARLMGDLERAPETLRLQQALRATPRLAAGPAED